ncbi:hypothetical protein UFOVP1620_28 [uncultured Caudovirales phage]|uniref:Uncharacterized protein n=1 Tax=uncultured Caudovirales phage TaxID=2100421 RepID=A0A6J5SYQ0_9CAUD|nr:hypothetical protein UFOVP1620_28 [uncultured Caudovirales phage]
MSSAYGFTEDSARRIARVVKAVEGDTTEPTRIGPMLGGSTMSVVKVTALGSPLNTGQRVDYHASADTMNDINEVKIREVSGAALTVGTRYMGQFSGYTSAGLPVFVVKTNAGGAGSTFEVVTGVVCHNDGSGIGVTTASLTTSDYDGAVFKNFLGLVDVIPKSFVGNASRIVMVNETADALEFGPNFSGSPTAADFLGLTDTPNNYSGANYKSVTCTASAVVFTTPNVTTTNSLVGGGNPNNTSVFTTLQLLNDVTSPGNYYAYSTNGSGVKGWYLQAATPAGLTVGGNVVVSARKAAVADVAAHTISSANLATTASTTQTAIDDLTTQVNLLLARIRSHGLIS